jgi:hypothetical protein
VNETSSSPPHARPLDRAVALSFGSRASTFRQRRARLYWLVLGALLAACGTAQTGAGKASAITVERLYPLRVGSVWTYDVDTGEGLPVLAITRVLAVANGQIEVSSGGDSLHYEQRPDGLFRADVDSYLIHTPIATGTTWQAADGSRAEITRVDARASTPGGDFNNCVEVLESGGPSEKRVRTVFCADIGPVEIESSLHMQLTGKVTRVLAKLRGYDFSGVALAPSP